MLTAANLPVAALLGLVSSQVVGNPYLDQTMPLLGLLPGAETHIALWFERRRGDPLLLFAGEILRRVGAEPIAARAGQRAFGATPISLLSFLPGAGGLGDTEHALREYAGFVAISTGLD